LCGEQVGARWCFSLACQVITISLMSTGMAVPLLKVS